METIKQFTKRINNFSDFELERMIKNILNNMEKNVNNQDSNKKGLKLLKIVINEQSQRTIKQ